MFYYSAIKAYSLDLRERVVAACQTGLTQPVVAAQFSVPRSFVAKLLRRQRTSGNVSALPSGRSPAPRLDAAALVQLTPCLRRLLHERQWQNEDTVRKPRLPGAGSPRR